MKELNLINKILEIYDNNTLIIGIDGLGGAGKSTISSKISDTLNQKGYNTIVLHIDDFIHPKSVRYNSNYPEWKCYYNLQWRYDYLIDKIINPIKNGSDFNQQIELYDKENDTYLLQELNVPKGSIIIVEGVFLQRKELKNCFDYTIYIDIPENVRLDRVLKRDLYIGDKQQIINKYTNRYFPAEHNYILECSPCENSDYIIKLDYTIREMKSNEYPLLEDFLYEAIFQPNENNLASKDIINKPELQVYIKDFGTQKDDFCFCAEIDNKIIGAVWVRNINGYGNIDNSTPEFAISIYKQYRGFSIGTNLMKTMLKHLKNLGYTKTSLAVQKENYAFKMYLSVGFEIVKETKNEYIMICNLKSNNERK